MEVAATAMLNITSGQSIAVAHTTVQSYSPDYASVNPYLISGSFGPPESATQMTSRSVQPFFSGLTTVTDRRQTMLLRL